MKYKTFRTLIIAGAFFGSAGFFILGYWHCDEEPVPQSSAMEVESPAVKPSSSTPAEKTVAEKTVSAESDSETNRTGGTLREMDQEILRRATQAISGDKIKDAFPARSYKVNLYQDPAQAKINRAKIDLDRDEKWDEKWTFSGDTVKRQVAPADDENFTLEYRLRGGSWVQKSE